MTIFNPNTSNMYKKLQEIEDEDIRSFMKLKGYSDKEINISIKNAHLHDEINRLEDILCEPEEVLDILVEDGWNKLEIENALMHRKDKRK